jgi:hypothetical protein
MPGANDKPGGTARHRTCAQRTAAGVAAVLAALTVPAAASAATGRAAFVPSADGYTRSDLAAVAAGKGGRLGAEGGGVREVSYLRFNVRVPEGSVVQSATLRIRSLTTGGRAGVDLRGVPDSHWSERGLTWASAPRPGRIVAHAARYAARRWVYFDATPLVHGAGAVTVALTSRGRGWHGFSSREARGIPPRLVVHYVPGQTVELPGADPAAGPAPTGGDPAPPAPPADPTAAPPAQPSADPPARPGWRLIFDDEFDGTSLDTTKWTPRKWDGGSFYDPSNVLLSGGLLRLRARSSGSSAMVQTHGKLDFTYGRVEASLKVPRGQGFWPALWLRPSDTSKPYPENDLLEMWMTDRSDDVFDENTAWITYHWVDDHGNHQQINNRFPGGPNYTQGFHEFATEWEPGEIRWYIDGVEKMRVDGPTVSTVPMFLIFSLQVGNEFWIPGSDGDPNSHTPYPSYLDADYIRVYQR